MTTVIPGLERQARKHGLVAVCTECDWQSEKRTADLLARRHAATTPVGAGHKVLVHQSRVVTYRPASVPGPVVGERVTGQAGRISPAARRAGGHGGRRLSPWREAALMLATLTFVAAVFTALMAVTVVP